MPLTCLNPSAPDRICVPAPAPCHPAALSVSLYVLERQEVAMRVSVGVVVLAILGRAAGFAGIATRSHAARLRQNACAFENTRSTQAARRPASWPKAVAAAAATTTVRGGSRALKASDQPAAVPSTRPPLDILAVGK